MRKHFYFLLTIFFIDRLVKNAVWFSISPEAQGMIHPVLNDRIAFSLPTFVSPISMIVLLSIVVIGLMSYCYILYLKKSLIFFAWGMVTVGALSNLLDRVTLGGVLDYIDLGWWPVFNISDIVISLGVISVLLFELMYHQRIKHHG